MRNRHLETPPLSPEELLNLSQLSDLPPPINLGAIAASYPALIKELKKYDPVKVAATMGGLLTLPALQSNCLRLEILTHLALAFCRGHKTPGEEFIRRSFSAIGQGEYGSYEDPAEDVFVASIETPRGNFRVLEGIWESAGFFLQRIVNLVEGMPDRDDCNDLRECVYSLLQLSDIVCERAKLTRYMLGNPVPQKILPRHVAVRLGLLRRSVRFSEVELRKLGVSIKQLSRFCFSPRNRSRLLDESIGHSTLERYPIVRHETAVVFVLPTAASAAIRRLVYELIDAAGMREVFLRALAHEYSNVFSHTPILGGKFGPPIKFNRTEHALIAETTINVDTGRYLNLIYFIDTLEEFEKAGFAGTDPDPIRMADDIDRGIDHVYEEVRGAEEFVDGITLLVGCGIGRGTVTSLKNKDRPNWHIESISAPDLVTLSWLPDYKELSLWRMLDGRSKLESLGVALGNINGLLNMVAWARSLEGHLVPHGKLPDDFVQQGAQSLVVITQNGLRDIRHQVLETFDPHVEQDIHGRWIRVRKEGRSFFAEDRRRPLYFVFERPNNHYPSAALVTSSRTWWCEIAPTQGTAGHSDYERLKMISVWLARAVPVLESVIRDLPPGPILWTAQFKGDSGEMKFPSQKTAFGDARAQIAVQVDSGEKIISTATTALFERAHFNSENVYERALVDAFVEGVASLAGKTFDETERLALTQSIVSDTAARETHVFVARSFLDYVRDALPKSPVTIDEDDSAIQKIGLGWRVRSRSDGPHIHGKSDCMTFLNSLVKSLEDELCNDLRQFDRVATIDGLLRNHESAVVNREWWRRTSAAVLSLHDDKAAAPSVMASHDLRLNAVFQSTRILVEIGICECLLEGGRTPGKLDMTRLMTKAAQIFHLGGWSDAIRWDAMEPRLRITPLGDVHANLDFIEEVIIPFSQVTHNAEVTEAVEQYARNLEETSVQSTVRGIFEESFLEAWEEQSGASLDDMRVFVDFIEDMGVQSNKAILKVRRSELLTVKLEGRALTEKVADTILDFLTMRPRAGWRDIPDGFSAKDIQPWRFRRRLSVLRKPIIQVNDADDPPLVVAPGILRSALIYMVQSYYQGDFPDTQLRKRMLSWSGKTRDDRGKAFNVAVAKRLNELGWRTEAEVKITKLLRKGFERDYGDVDVLVWRPELGRVLILECKDVQYRKTYGEIAEQLADFRGEINSDGKPDHLLRHLNRVEIVSKHLTALAEYIGMASIQSVESHLVFRNPVPMEFASNRMARRVTLNIFDRLDQI